MEKLKTIVAPVLLKGPNYLLWSRTLKTTLCSHGLWHHILEAEDPFAVIETTQADEDQNIHATDVSSAKWFQENQLVLSIIQSSLDSSLLEAYSYCESAYELWNMLKNVYGNESNLLRIFELKKSLNDLHQDDMEFTKLLGKYRALWAELDMLRPSTVDPMILNERRDQDKVFGLLLTLNANYMDLIKHILREDKLPSLEEVCGKIQKEQGAQGLFVNKPEQMVANKGFYKPEEKKGLWCSYCKKSGHTRNKCFILHPNLRPKSWNASSGPGAAHISKTVSTTSNTSSCAPSNVPSSSTLTRMEKESNIIASTPNDFVRRSDLEALVKALHDQNGKTVGSSYHAYAFAKLANTANRLIVDSGATHHMISDVRMLENVVPAIGNVVIANGTNVPIEGLGTLRLFEKETKAFYMPKFTSNLLSVKRATNDLHCNVIFSPDDVSFQDIESKEIIGKGGTKDDLYLLEDLTSFSSSSSLSKSHSMLISCFDDRVSSNVAMVNDSTWHARLGHPHVKALNLLFPNILFNNTDCEACILGKHCRSVFTKSQTSYDKCFDLVHSDVWTSPCESRDCHKYFVSFIDEKSKYTWITLLSSKSKVLEAFINFQSYVTNNFNAKIKVFRSDNGGEYTSHAFRDHLLKHGIEHQTSCPYTPQQNGVAERKNRHLMDVARSMMFHSNVPKRFWSDAVTTASYLINRLPTKVLGDKTPFEVLNASKPNLSHLRVFGCVCYVLVPGELRSKLEARSTKAMFIGYSTSQKGYKCYDHQARKVLVSRDVKFVESEPFYTKASWDSIKDISSTNESDRASSLRHILENLGLVAPTNIAGTNAPPQSGLHPRISPDEASSSSSTTQGPSDSFDHVSSPILDSAGGVYSHEHESHGHEVGDDESNDRVQSPLAHSPVVQPHEYSDSPGLKALSKSPEAYEHVEAQQLAQAPGLRRSTRVKYPPSHWKNTRVYFNGAAEAHPEQVTCNLAVIPQAHQVFLASVDQGKIPKTYEEAKELDVWVDAVLDEKNAMIKNHTWDEATLPKGKKAVSSKWIFTIKYKSNGEIERYKARLVARGFTQTYGDDYRDTFAPVAKLHTVRVVLSLATNLDWELWQMDVKNAFLQGELEEEVYMTPPPGLEDACGPGKVLRLRKAIYGLKQSPRAWYHKLSMTLRDRGFRRAEADHTLFTKQSKEGIVVVLIYVDDIIISGSNKEEIQSTKEYLKSMFEIKDLGELKYFLGIEVCRFKDGLFISQRKYTHDLLVGAGMIDSKPAKTPLPDDYKLEPEGELDRKPFDDPRLYRKIVGKLIYLTITRPDICFAVNQVSQFMQEPKMHHWKLVQRVLRYLQGTYTQGVWMGRNQSTEVVGYCDADWAGDRQDRKSTTGYCTFVGGNLVTWKTKKQKVVSCSSAEAEYRAMRKLTTECMWLKMLLEDLGFTSSKPITIHCDNQAAIHIASNPVFHERTKHIEVDCHKVREAIEMGITLPCFTRSSDQLADIMTKAISMKSRDYICSKLGVIDLPTC